MMNPVKEEQNLQLQERISELEAELVMVRREAELTRGYTEVALHSKSILFNALPIGIVGVDEDSLVTEWNAEAEQIFGLAWKSVVGRPLPETQISWDWGTVLSAATKCQETNTQIQLPDVTLKRGSGEPIILSITMKPLAPGEGDYAGYLLLVADITERRALEEQLAHNRKLESIGQLAAGIAHEMNTPLQYIGDNTRFLETSFGQVANLLVAMRNLMNADPSSGQSADFCRELLEVAKGLDLSFLQEEIPAAISEALGGIAHVTRLVVALKEFSHPGKSEKAGVDIHRALENTLVVATNELKYVADVVTEFAPENLSILGLPGEINQVFLNVIVNAAHAIAETDKFKKGQRGTITIKTRRDGQSIEIAISDTGTGIPLEIQPKIFDPFFTTKDVGHGTGQGLALAYASVVKKHDGTISFETEPGKGTTFFIRLPADVVEDKLPPGMARKA